MGSMRLVYDAEGDILDVDFRLTGEKPHKGIEVHENITVWTDAAEKHILRLMVLSYTALCGQPLLTLTGVQAMPLRRRTNLLKLLRSEPVKRFLVPAKEHPLQCRIVAPGVHELAAA